MDDCLFCKIISGDIPSDRVLETETAIAFRDVNPQAPVHVLIVPRAHIESIHDLEDQAVSGDLMTIATQVAEQEGIAESGYRVVTNVGVNSGQSVAHLHFHVLGGRALTWPPG